MRDAAINSEIVVIADEAIVCAGTLTRQRILEQINILGRIRDATTRPSDPILIILLIISKKSHQEELQAGHPWPLARRNREQTQIEFLCRPNTIAALNR